MSSSGLQLITYGLTAAKVRRRRRSVELPQHLAGVKRVTTMKMLGVTVTNTLSVAEHVQAIMRACSPTIHALRVLRCHGLSDAALQTAYRAIVVARLTYATSAWWGYHLRRPPASRRFPETRHPGRSLQSKLPHRGDSGGRH